MDFKGTKGEWSSNKIDPTRVWVERENGDNSCVCHCDNQHYKGGVYVDINHNELKANAKLIAAAPDLLESLKNCLSLMESEGKKDWSEYTEGKKAIEKALK